MGFGKNKMLDLGKTKKLVFLVALINSIHFINPRQNSPFFLFLSKKESLFFTDKSFRFIFFFYLKSPQSCYKHCFFPQKAYLWHQLLRINGV